MDEIWLSTCKVRLVSVMCGRDGIVGLGSVAPGPTGSCIVKTSGRDKGMTNINRLQGKANYILTWRANNNILKVSGTINKLRDERYQHS